MLTYESGIAQMVPGAPDLRTSSKEFWITRRMRGWRDVTFRRRSVSNREHCLEAFF